MWKGEEGNGKRKNERRKRETGRGKEERGKKEEGRVKMDLRTTEEEERWSDQERLLAKRRITRGDEEGGRC